MSLVRCDGCQQRVGDKPFTTYFAWRRADGQRASYRARLCTTCYMSKVVPLDIDYTSVERLTCPSCGIDTEDDHDSVWVTSYIPKYGQRDVESPMCGACAAQYRVWVVDHGSVPEASGEGPRGPSPMTSAEDVLRGLGIAPRAS